MVLFQYSMLILSLSFLSIVLAGSDNDTCNVSVHNIGSFQGICDERDGSQKFLSIPYAEKPIGKLRFALAKEPMPNQTTSGVNSSNLPSMCPQYDLKNLKLIGQEDCLYLNIFTPDNSRDEKKPVMVWIHGGSFYSGSSSTPQFDGTKLAQQGDVIVITLNYRLGYLGYYDSAETGTNFGMSDVIMALNWVKKHINSFGGDHKNLTIFGESTGATMVRYLINSNRASGLFSRAILQSDPQFFGPQKKNISQDILGKFLLEKTDCDSVDCLRQLETKDILEAQAKVLDGMFSDKQFDGIANKNFPISPNLDGDFIKSDLTQTQKVENPVDLIVGTTKDEAAVFIDELGITGSGEDNSSIISKIFRIDKGNMTSLGTNSLIKLATNTVFTCPDRLNAMKYAQSHSEKSVYVYEFSKGILDPANRHQEGEQLCGKDNRVCHQDDLYLVFGTYPESTTDNSLKKLSLFVQTLWTDFAKTGTPGSSSWDKLSSSNGSTETVNYFDIGQTNQMKSADINFLGCS